MSNSFYSRIFLSLVILLSASTLASGLYFYSWAGLSANQYISRDNLLNGISTGALVQKIDATIPSGSKYVTKAELLSWVYIDPTNTGLSAKGNSQYITKSGVTPKTVYTINIFGTVGIGCTDVYLNAVSNVPVSGDITVQFEWCADNGANTTSSVTIYSGTSSNYKVENSANYGGSGCVGTDVKVKDTNLSVSTGLNADGYTVLITTVNWDNGCNFSIGSGSGIWCRFGG